MSKRIHRLLPVMGLLMLWGIAFTVSAQISAIPLMPTEYTAQRSLADAMFGECRVVVSSYFYEKADEYLHGGVPHLSDRAFENSFYQELERKVAPSHHFHIRKADITEIMPWLWLAIRSDPSNGQTYMVAAFWLDHDANRPDIAIQVLQEAQASIPFNIDTLPVHVEVQYEKGRIHLRQRQVRAAERSFDAGLRYSENSLDQDSDYAVILRSRLLLYRALLYEADGNQQSAIACLVNYLKTKPDDVYVIQRLKDLQSGDAPDRLVSRYLEDILKQDDDSRQSCAREGHDHNDHEDHEHDD